MQANIFAFTAADEKYPAYICVSDADGELVITLRGPRPGNTTPLMSPGETASMSLPREEVNKLRCALDQWLDQPAR
jgi:hypothetical protein